MKVNRTERSRRIAVSERNIRKTAQLVLGQGLVSVEIDYLQRTLGASTTQEEMERGVRDVRRMPLSSMMSGK